jgi:hypothetical protein
MSTIHGGQKKGPGVSDGAFGDFCDVLSARAQAKNPWIRFFNRNAFCGDELHCRGSYANRLRL